MTDCHHCIPTENEPAHRPNPWVTSAQATLHCLVGCSIGEVAGLMIGVSLGLGVWPIIMLDTALAFLAGFTLSLIPLVKDQKLSFAAAFRAIWLGEVISIGVMELVMNAVDYQMGGMQPGSVLSPMFWTGVAAAIPAGFVAAWPVNHWLLKKEIKRQCH